MRFPAFAFAVSSLVLLAGCSSPPASEGGGDGGGATSGSASTGTGTVAGGFPAFVPPAQPACPGHWHVTFAVYVPGADGQPDLLDLSVPRLQSGRAYYDFGVAPNMTVAAHLHQSGPERGDAALGPFQMHYEASGRCTGIGAALRGADVDVGNGTLRAFGGHAYSGQAGQWNATSSLPLRVLVQTQGNGTWEWREADVAQGLAYQPRDGESFLVAIGAFTDADLRSLADAIPAPESRAE